MPAPFLTLSEYGAARDTLLASIVDILEADSRVVAAWLSGSFGRGEDDEWADFDLHIAVGDEHYQQFLDERPLLYRRAGMPILIQNDMPSDSMPSGRYQLVFFAGALMVDWNIGPLSKALRPLAYKMLLERVAIPVVAPSLLTLDQRRAYTVGALTFFWAMAPIAIKYAGRTETRRAVMQTELLSQAFIVLSRLASEPNGPDPRLHETNRILEDEIDSRLARVGSAIDSVSALEVIRQICDAVEALHPTLEEVGVSIPAAMPDEVRALWTLAMSVARAGPQPRRKYR